VGRTREHFDNLRRGIGERAWTALYQGSPVSLEGGLILREWIDSHRLPSQPVRPLRTIVALDPSESGTGDHCGLIAATLARDAAGQGAGGRRDLTWDHPFGSTTGSIPVSRTTFDLRICTSKHPVGAKLGLFVTANSYSIKRAQMAV
jgi:hypothetical protein